MRTGILCLGANINDLNFMCVCVCVFGREGGLMGPISSPPPPPSPLPKVYTYGASHTYIHTFSAHRERSTE